MTKLDDIEHSAKLTRNCDWVEIRQPDLLALIKVARLTILRRRNAIARAHATGEKYDALMERDLMLWEQQDAELAKLLDQDGAGLHVEGGRDE